MQRIKESKCLHHLINYSFHCKNLLIYKFIVVTDHRPRQGQVGRQVDPVPRRDRQTIQKSDQRKPQIPERTVDIPVGQIEAP